MDITKVQNLSVEERVDDTFANSAKMHAEGEFNFKQLLSSLKESHSTSAEIEVDLKDLFVEPFVEGYRLSATFRSSTYNLSNTACSQYLASSTPPLRMNLLDSLRSASFDEHDIFLPMPHQYLNYVRYYALKNRVKKKLLVDLQTDELKAVVGVNYPSFFKTYLLMAEIVKELKRRSFKIMFLQPTETENGYFRLPIALKDLSLPGFGEETYFSIFVSNSEVGTGALTFGTGALNVQCYNGLYSLDHLSSHSIDHQSTGHFYNQVFKFMAEHVPSAVSVDEFHYLSTRLDNVRDIRRYPHLEKIFYEALAKSVVNYSLNTYDRWHHLIKIAQKTPVADLKNEIAKQARKYNFKRQEELLYEIIMNDPVIAEKDNQLALINGLTRMANQSTINGQKRLDLQHAAGKILVTAERRK